MTGPLLSGRHVFIPPTRQKAQSGRCQMLVSRARLKPGPDGEMLECNKHMEHGVRLCA